MTPQEEARVQAIVNELTGQRNSALDRCANLAGDIALLQARVKELEEKYEKKEGA